MIVVDELKKIRNTKSLPDFANLEGQTLVFANAF